MAGSFRNEIRYIRMRDAGCRQIRGKHSSRPSLGLPVSERAAYHPSCVVTLLEASARCSSAGSPCSRMPRLHLYFFYMINLTCVHWISSPRETNIFTCGRPPSVMYPKNRVYFFITAEVVCAV